MSLFDSTRLSAELDHIYRALSGVIAQPHGHELLSELRRELDRPDHTLLRHALLSDCVRLAAGAVTVELTVDASIDSIADFLASAARSYSTVSPQFYGAFAGATPASARTFLYRHATDEGPFGLHAAQPWPGLELCREAEHLRFPEARQRYTRLMGWLLHDARKLAVRRGPGLPKSGDAIGELAELLNNPAAPVADHEQQVRAFLAPTQVFSHVEYASSVFDDDPFDVDVIQPTARRAFARVVQQVMAPQASVNAGGMLLLLGDAGMGKTHLLRSFRQHIQEHGRGYAVYVPLHANTNYHAHYLLQYVVDSLVQPYPSASSGLHALARGIIEKVPEPLRSQLDALARGELDVDAHAEVIAYIHRLADDVQTCASFPRIDLEMLRAMLFALLPGMVSRVERYLRCLDLSKDDRRWLGDLVPRTGPGEAARMIRELARLAALRDDPFVIMVDQAEGAIQDVAARGTVLGELLDTLHGLVSEVPSLLAVVGYVADAYDTLRPRLTRAMLDRIEVNPPPIRLSQQRGYPELEALVSRRLAWLYAKACVVYRPEAPIYPFPEHGLRDRSDWPARQVLMWCQQFQRQSVAAGRVIDDVDLGTDPDYNNGLQLVHRAWAQALESTPLEIPDQKEVFLAALAEGFAACNVELELHGTHAEETRDNLLAIRIAFQPKDHRRDIVIGWTHRDPAAGAFGNQLAALCKLAKGAIPIAMRHGPFPTGTASSKAMATVREAGGLCLTLDNPTLRVLAAAQKFQPVAAPDRVLAWRQIERPISSLQIFAEILERARIPTVSVKPPAAKANGAARSSVAKDTPAPKVKPPRAKPRARPPSAKHATA